MRKILVYPENVSYICVRNVGVNTYKTPLCHIPESNILVKKYVCVEI
jgi:hypothetical protein